MQIFIYNLKKLNMELKKNNFEKLYIIMNIPVLHSIFSEGIICSARTVQTENYLKDLIFL